MLKRFLGFWLGGLVITIVIAMVISVTWVLLAAGYKLGGEVGALTAGAVVATAMIAFAMAIDPERLK